MHMLSVGATGEERGKAVFFGLFSSLIGLVGATIGFFFTWTFYPRDYFPRSLFQEDSSPYHDSGFDASYSGSSDFDPSDFDTSGFGSEGTGSDGFDLLFGVAGLIFVAIGVVWVVFSLGLILRIVRAAAWLDGTRGNSDDDRDVLTLAERLRSGTIKDVPQRRPDDFAG
jgi:uncharacterized membrane protein